MYQDTPAITTPPQGHSPVLGSTLRVKAIDGQTLGAIITGVQVNAISDEEFKVIRKMVDEHAVVVIKEQNLTPQEQAVFAKRFPHSKTCDQMKFCGPLALE